MSRVLVVAYHFPPIGGAGVQRNAKFARYLPELGYELVVVTGPGGDGSRWTPEDPTLNDDVAPGVEVSRVPGPPPAPEGGLRGRAGHLLGLEDAWERWWADGAVAAGLEAGPVDVIYASLEPYWSSAVAAMELSRKLGVPWVADLQDPWALDEMRIYPSDLHRRREVRRMREALNSADVVVMNTPEAMERVQRHFPELRAKPVVSITNGFDEADFDRPAPARDDDAFRIVHTGFLHTEIARRQHATGRIRRLIGGAVEPRVDLLTRSHVFLLEAVNRLLADDPSLEQSLEVHFAGVLSPADLEVAASSPVVRLRGYLPHHETVDVMRSADLLFLPMQDLPPGTPAGIIPGKTFEYVASGRPILAAVPDGDARDLLARAGTALLSRPGDVEAMAALIRGAVDSRRRGEAPPELRTDAIAPYERRELARSLAEVFDGVLQRAPSLASVT